MWIHLMILFVLFFAWGSLAAVQRQADGLALAQLSRDNGRRWLQDGVVRASPIKKPEDLAFEPPTRPHPSTAPDNADVELLNGLRLLDTVLLASIDGRFHAVNRTNGRPIWSMEDDAELAPSQGILHNLVRTDHNLQSIDTLEQDNKELYIIEPQSGDIFILDPDTDDEPLRRLPYTVPQLVELSPFSFDDPNRVFVGKKETSIIEVDIDEGIVKSVMSGTNDWLHEGEDDSDDDGWSRAAKRIVQIGRTDYTIKVISHNSVLQTLSFSTYGPNNMNKQLQTVWKRTPDDIYLQPSWDGQTYAFETLGESAIWAKAFRQPIVAVFDVVIQDTGIGAPRPIVLLQPRPRLQELFPTRAAQLGGIRDKTVVNRIGNSLYAMGHLNYPLVNLAEVYLEIEGPPQGSSDEIIPKCVDVTCFTGVKYAELEGAKSRISRLIDAPRKSETKSQVATRDIDEQDALEDPVATTLEVAALPLPSRFSSSPVPSRDGDKIIGLLSQLDNHRPKAKTPIWTLVIPFVGGFLAIWVLLRRLIKVNSNPGTNLIQPLQDPSLSLEATRPPLTPRIHPQTPSDLPPPFVTSPSSSNILVPSAPANIAETDSNEKGEPGEKVGPDVNLSLAIDDPRGGPALGVVVNVKEGEESEKDDSEQHNSKKRRRRTRRKPRAPQPVASSSAEGKEAIEPGPAVDSGSPNGGYVLIEKEEPQATLPIPDPPMPVTTSTSSLVVGNKVLGYGSHGTIVYEGSLQGRAVAVKRLLQDFTTLASHEVSLLLQADDHPNVIRYYFSMTRESFLYIALELCPCSLADLIETPAKHPDIFATFEPKRALSQITHGLRHLHSLKIVHRDIKPQNILVSGRKGDGSHRMLISDFGLCKKLEIDQTSFLPTMAAGGGHGIVAAGTPGWRAPEILRGDVNLDEEVVTSASDSSRGGKGPKGGSSNDNARGNETRLTKSVDIFALGCIFYYTLVNGEHPFGEKYIREINILSGKFDLTGLEKFGEEGVEAQHLIERMLGQDSKARPDTNTILLHPFFWTPARRLTFLQDASDRFEIMEREPREPGLVALETGAFGVVGHDWHKRLDKVFIDNLGKYRKYQGASVQDLLRALRNKKHHYQDLPDNVKRHLGPLPDGFLSYFTRRFPNLLMHVHSVISSLPLRDEPMFKTYFELEL